MARVLVLEDDNSMRDVLSVMLQSLGHDAVEASSWTAAECHQAEAPCDLILADLDVADGHAGLRRLRHAHPDLPILATDPGSGCDADAGVAHVDNPFHLGELYDSLEQALDPDA